MKRLLVACPALVNGDFNMSKEDKGDRMVALENALYEVINSKDLAYAKQIAADVLEEDLDDLYEEELEELNFDDDSFIVDEDFDN